MTLIRPDFRLEKANPNPRYVTDAAWWLWLRLDELEPQGALGGIYADKSGFHNTGSRNQARWPGNYSIRDATNRRGRWWKSKASALDWTFPDAQRGVYRTIDRYTSRLVASALNASDPRLDLVLYEFYGQADNDRDVEGYNEFHERPATSDSSHLWHIHMSFLRSQCGDFWGMWALLTVLMGWNVAKWRDSLPEQPSPAPAPPKPTPVPPKPTPLPSYPLGSRVLRDVNPDMRGTDVRYVQKWIGPRCGSADGAFGSKTRSGVVWYQRMRGIRADGIVGPATWKHMGIG